MRVKSYDHRISSGLLIALIVAILSLPGYLLVDIAARFASALFGLAVLCGLAILFWPPSWKYFRRNRNT